MKKIPKNAITEKQLRKKLELVAARDFNSRADWAKTHNITAQSVSAFMTRNQGAGLMIPRALGFEPVTIYVPIESK